MKPSIKNILMSSLFVICFTIGIVIGLKHLRLGLMAIFVFKNNEPLSSWIFIICGPISTLPAVITSLFNKEFAGYWLVSGGFLSFAAMLFERETMMIRISAPMILIGVAFIGIALAHKSESATHNQTDAPDQKTVR